MYYPVLNLTQKIKTYFPQATVFVQSLLPIRYDTRKPENPKVVDNVHNFNKLLLKAAASLDNCFYFNVFDKFYDKRSGVPIPSLYTDNVHLSRDGLSVLARVFIQIIRGRNSSVISI